MAALSTRMRTFPKFVLLTADGYFPKARLTLETMLKPARCLHSCRGTFVRPVSCQRQLLYKHRVTRVISAHRHNTTHTVETFIPTLSDPSYIPSPPSPYIPDQIDISSSLNTLGEPTLSSLGLCNWSPAGLVQACLETLHVSMDIPWWGAIAIGVIFLRVLIFPIVVISQRNMMHMSNHMPGLTVLHQKFTAARHSNNMLDAARLANDIQNYNQKHDIKPFRNFLMPMVQAPIFLSVFFGIRKMAELPVESMKHGGLFWFTDLTIADPYYLLPLISMATMSLIIEVGADGMKSGAMAKNMKWVMRALPIVFFPFVSHFPAAMVCYWCTSNTISLMQTALLRLPSVRSYFMIPKAVVHDTSSQPPKPPFIEGLRETLHNSRVITELQNRERADAVRFKQAGMGPLVKTYKYDPTKPHPDTPPTEAKQSVSAKQRK